MSTPSKLGILQSEAGHNAQSDIGYAVTLAQSLAGEASPAELCANRSVHGETEPKKATQVRAGHKLDLTLLETIPLIHPRVSSMSKGF